MTAHKQGCDALGGYGHGKGPCTCGASMTASSKAEELVSNLCFTIHNDLACYGNDANHRRRRAEARAALLALIAELEADARRFAAIAHDFSPMGLDINGMHSWVYRRNLSLRGPTLRDAIDALKEQGNG